MNQRFTQNYPSKKIDFRDELKRFSNNFPQNDYITKQQEMAKKLNQVRLKNYIQTNDQQHHGVIFLVLIFLFVFVLIFSNINMFQGQKQNIKYCDSDDYYYNDCVQCPLDARCSSSKIVECFDNKIIYNQECVVNEKFEKLKSNMLNYIDNYLQYKNGESEFKNKNSLKYVNKSEIVKILTLQFGQNKEIQEVIREIDYNIGFDPLNRFNFEYLDNGEEAIYSQQKKFSFYQKIYKFFSENFWLFLLIILSILLSGIYYQNLQENKKFEELALPIYKELLNQVQEQQLVPQQQIIQKISHLSNEERLKIMKMFEKIRVLDEQITSFEKNGVLFWVFV